MGTELSAAALDSARARRDGDWQETQTAIQRDKMANLGELTAGIAHELNNPIGYISSNINTLQRYAVLLTTLIDEAEAGMTEAARALWRQRLLQVRWPFIRQDLTALISETRQGAEHVKDVVGDLKTLARSSTVPEQVNPDVCVRSALTVLSHQLKHRTVVTPRLACTESVRMVRSQVTQLLINLVHNALESLPAQGGEIRIATHQGPGGTTISVEDNGPGIPAAVRERIFEPFYTTKEHGTGLGLAIAQQIAQAHAGRLECDSSPELRGARFILRFSGMPASGPLPVATA